MGFEFPFEDFGQDVGIRTCDTGAPQSNKFIDLPRQRAAAVADLVAVAFACVVAVADDCVVAVADGCFGVVDDAVDAVVVVVAAVVPLADVSVVES